MVQLERVFSTKSELMHKVRDGSPLMFPPHDIDLAGSIT